jgi:hypothetical protein
MAPSLTTWTRLEPYSSSVGLDGGLRAAVHDPLWLLARQWQVGEFQAEDGGSPVNVQMQIDCTPLTRYQGGGIPATWYQDGLIRSDASSQAPKLDRNVPLEALVERERIRIESAWQPRLAAEAGLQFWRCLDSFGLAAQRAAVLTHFPLQAPADNAQSSDVRTRRFLLLMAGRVPDGALLAAVIRAVQAASALTALSPQVALGVQKWQSWQQNLSAADRTRAADAVAAWLIWYGSDDAMPQPTGARSGALLSEPKAAGPQSWIPERLDYAALAAAPTPNGEVVLAAPEYVGGHLDWYAFNVLPAGSLGAVRGDLTDDERRQESVTCSAVPTPVSFPGMPRPRWWEFEDARVDFGAVAAGPQQLVQLLLVDFALIYGNDRFIIPVILPVGTLCRTNWLLVRDAFGEGSALVQSARSVDAQFALGTDPQWDLFRLSPDRRATAGTARTAPDALFLPPTLGSSLQGAAIEEVLFLRDEMANMAWAVERIVESPLGQPSNRSETYFRARRQSDATNQPVAAGGADPPALVYQLVKDIPDHWVPLLPVRVTENAAPIGLHRAAAWQGLILQPRLNEQTHLPVPIRDEEVPREGARVTRAFQYARWTKGETYLWVGRRKGVGRGEGSSGVRFDVLETPPQTAP